MKKNGLWGKNNTENGKRVGGGAEYSAERVIIIFRKWVSGGLTGIEQVSLNHLKVERAFISLVSKT